MLLRARSLNLCQPFRNPDIGNLSKTKQHFLHKWRSIPIKSALSRIYIRFLFGAAIVSWNWIARTLHNINTLRTYTRTNIISLTRFIIVVVVAVVVILHHPFIDYFHVYNLLRNDSIWNALFLCYVSMCLCAIWMLSMTQPNGVFTSKILMKTAKKVAKIMQPNWKNDTHIGKCVFSTLYHSICPCPLNVVKRLKCGIKIRNWLV